MATLSQVSLPSLLNGIVREAAVDETLVPVNTAQLLQNLHCDQIGALTLRKGLTLLGSQISSGNSILGMANYINNARDNFKLLANVGGQVYSYGGTSWGSVRNGITDGAKARFTNFIDLTYMVNGTDATQTYNGTSFSTSNVASLPVADNIENYRSRIWCATKSNDKVYYSNVVSTSQTITGGTSFIQISPQDGEQITGLKRHSRALLVFKNNHIYKIYSINSADPDPSISRGTYSQESIIEGKNGISFHHPSGFYNFNFDGQPTDISRPIIDIVRAIPRSAYENIVGWTDDDDAHDGDHKYWSVGDLTIDGVTFTNVVCRFTISTQIWTVYSYGTDITASSRYDDGTNIYTIVGDEDGNALKFDNGATDNTKPIHYDLQTHWYYFTAIKSKFKSITEINTLSENAQGASLQFQIDTDSSTEWRDISQITQSISQIDNINAMNFRRIRFRLYGNSAGSPFIFRGWEILSTLTEGDIKYFLRH